LEIRQRPFVTSAVDFLRATLSTPPRATKEATKLIAEKTKKGYTERP
jgi:predicted DNA-binding WGR domain protein